MFLKINQQLERCRRVIRQRVRPHIHPVLQHLNVESFDIPGEPMPTDEFFAKLDRDEISFQPFVMGSQWGTTWGTTWFRLSGRIPQGKPDIRPLELWIDLGWYDHSCGGHIEGLVYRADGTAIKAVHPLNHWVPLVAPDGTSQVPIDADGTFVVYLEAASNPLLLGVPPFIETELGECATGRPDEPYTFRAADLTEYDERFQDYWTDLDVVDTVMAELDKESPRYWQMAKALQRSLNLFDEQDLDTVEQARAALSGVLSKPANASSMDVSAIGHAHIDSAWLWPVRETRRKVARTVANALALMDDDPDFKYAMSSAQQYAWLEQDHPDLFARMKQRIAEGRFIPVGGMWVESDGMVPTGESLIRQISYGRRYFKEHLGVEPKGVWLPDSFGYTGSWPQIARRAGYEWFLTQKISWGDTTKYPHHSFLWEGIDGTRIFTHFPPTDTYAAWMTAKELVYGERNFNDKDLSDKALMLFGFGDGGGGPTREMMKHIHRFENLESVSRVHIEPPDDFFRATEAQMRADAGEEMPIFKGELYLELHRGTLTSQQDMKRGCRQEESLLRVVEYLCAAASIADTGYTYPTAEMDRIWTTLLLNQFHDILPGSGIAWVHREAREDYRRDLERLTGIAEDACAVLRRVNPDADLLPEAKLSQYRCDGRSWTPVACAVADGADVTIERRDDDSLVCDNGLLRVGMNADGSIRSVIDLARGRELVPSGSLMGVYELLKDEPSVYDAWEIERDALLMHDTIEGGRVIAVDCDGDRAAVTVRNEFGSSTIETTMTLRRGARAIDFHCSIDWRERERFLKVDLPVSLVALDAQYDAQYGLVQRPIAKSTASEEAKFESCTNRFVRIAEPDYSVAVINGNIYGSDVQPIAGDAGHGRDAGTMIRLSLLSAPVYPDPHTDLGRHEFDWSVVADATIDRTLDAAAVVNTPVLSDVPMIAPLVSLETKSGTAVIDWVKLADDGSGDVIVRLYEAAGGHAEAVLHVAAALSGATVRETDVLEHNEPVDDLPVCLPDRGAHSAEGVSVQLKPFEFATLRISR